MSSMASYDDPVAVDSDVDVEMIDRDDISNYNPEQILPESPENIQKIRSWLEPTSYDNVGGEFRKHQAAHVAGTGVWLTSSSTYQEWLQGEEHGLLWIKGIPGSGKSVMAANLVNEIAASNPGCPVLFFFFRQIIDANHDPKALLRDWLDQVLDYSPPLQKKLKTYLRRTIESISMEDMWKDLKMALENLPGNAFCIADALDEMDQGNNDFLSALGDLGWWRPKTVKVLITSRPVPTVEDPLRLTPYLHIRLEEKMVDADISKYVQYTLSNSAIPQSEWEVIMNAVPGRANGLFLYAKLAMDAFLEQGADITEVISRLPADLNVLYTDLLKEHARRSGVADEIQHLILQAVTHASRPLRLLELAELIKVISPDGSTRDLKTTKSLIRAACGPLLEILADETVSVIHHSFTEYLKGTTRSEDDPGYPILQRGPTHAALAASCLQYLQAGCLESVSLDQPQRYSRWQHEESDRPVGLESRLKHPFFEYAINNWAHHANRSESAGHDQTALNVEIGKLLGDDDNRRRWLRMEAPGYESLTPLHIAAKEGLISYTKEVLKTSEVDALSQYDQTPLWMAAANGHADIIRVLAAAGADLYPQRPDQGEKPLVEAASKNHFEAVRAFLEAGVDPIPRTEPPEDDYSGFWYVPTQDTALECACNNGHLETVKVFLSFIDEIDTVHRALAWAAERGRWKVVARILQVPGVDVNNTLEGNTPLFHACAWPQDLKTIRVLLEAGADPNVKCKGTGADYTESVSASETLNAPTPKFNCLHSICRWATTLDDYTAQGDPEILSTLFSLLVEAGVDVHQLTATGKTLLHRTAKSALMTRLLLDAGVDANIADNDGCTPLHVVENQDVMRLLIENGHAGIEARTRSGQTPLLYMLDRSHNSSIFYEFGDAGKNTPTLDQLLEYNPNCKAIDHKGNGVLHLALQQRRFNRDRIRALLAAGADPNLRNQEGLAPLAYLDDFKSGVSELFDLLVDAGADIDAVDRNGATHLFRLFSDDDRLSPERFNHTIQHLVDRGASILARDRKGRTLLHQVIKHHDVEDREQSESDMLARLDSLISRGLNLEAVDHYGNGLLHELALREENSDTEWRTRMMFLWEQLIERGLDVEAKNHAGRTPLHIMCAPGDHRKNDDFDPRSFMPIDYVISRMKKVDCADLDGITPLHIAATGDEFYTNRLLDAGGDPKLATYEGMTPLHIAARCRESNMVGRLLDALRKRYGTTKPVTGVNAQTFDREESTPLFYACQSGRPETVAFLLEAGADVKIGKPFEACIGFEGEDQLWKDPHPSTEVPENGKGVSAVKIKDTSRRVPNIHGLHGLTEQSAARLEEILDMLIKHGAEVYRIDGFDDGSFSIGQAIQREEHYLAACLKEVLTEHGRLKEPRHEHYIADWNKVLQPLTNEASIGIITDLRLLEAGQSNHELVSFLLARRKYFLVERLAHMGATFLPNRDKDWGLRSNLSTLIRYGFSRLVDKIGTFEAESRLEKGDWHAFGDKTRPGLWNAEGGFFASEKRHDSMEPFIMEAVRRQLPNMDVVRLLVEKFGVDVNEMSFPPVSAMDIEKSSALHLVAFGRAWWHVHQALPYLLEAGADINIRNSNGQTPLLISLGGIGFRYLYGPYCMDATKMLIEAGADVNASDDKGTSCLALAHNDIDLIRLLRSHGATVTADVLFAAIQDGNLEGLEEFLSGDVDANMRRPKKPDEKQGQPSQDLHASWTSAVTEEHEYYPLMRCPRELGNKWIGRHGLAGQQRADEAFRMMQLLLDHGANPLARLRQVEKSSKKADVKYYVEVTVLHHILRNGWLVGPMLSVPDLDVNCRDSKGRTLLHAACESRQGADYGVLSRQEDEYRTDGTTIFKKLLSLGADLEARDDFGRNVLHHMIHDHDETKKFGQFRDSLAYVLDKAPNLMDQADGDGWTPLYYAIRQGGRGKGVRAARALFLAGADPSVIATNGENLLHVLAPYLEVEEILDLFEELVGRGLDVNKRNNMGDTPLFAFYGRADSKELFCGGKRRRYPESDDGMRSPQSPAYSPPYSPTSPASSRSPRSPSSPTYSPILERKPQELGITREREAVKMLRRVGADFFAKDAKGRGLLHVAASRSVRTFSDLMELGLDTMLEDDAQQTPLDVAAAFENESVLQLFEKDKKDGVREAKVARSPLPVPAYPEFDEIYPVADE
ncbi:ankyrin repeat-containing domain protein [Fusarium solani]|uniref:Ankyrin repeat-containing domain protein n=1 Tax=Fusarium solani TaxID=169388 RepID=A0A9P9H927_FUSSL|nr:ankyrin repeat-containing domain protein [Fusarium solani]KAH7253300.1 ankyrin repeat-containing domain protein [Fusarium solani]